MATDNGAIGRSAEFQAKNARLTGNAQGSGIGIYNPVDFPDAWDLCSLGSIILPGITKIDVDRDMKLDVLTAPAQDGANIIISGAPPAKVVITNVIGTVAHWTDLNIALDFLETSANRRRNGRTPYAYSLTHPMAALRRVEAVIIESIKGPTLSGPGGVWTTTFACLEKRNPLKVVPIPKPVTLAPAQSAANPSAPPAAPSATRAPRP